MQPQLRLLNRDGFTFGSLTDYHDRFRDGVLCLGPGDLAWGLHSDAPDHSLLETADITLGHKLPVPGEKHLVTFGWTKNGMCAFTYDTSSDSDNCNMMPPRLLAGKDFLRVINIIGDLRMSPITVMNDYPTPGEMSFTLYTELPIQSERIGAFPQLQQQFGMRHERIIP